MFSDKNKRLQNVRCFYLLLSRILVRNKHFLSSHLSLSALFIFDKNRSWFTRYSYDRWLLSSRTPNLEIHRILSSPRAHPLIARTNNTDQLSHYWRMVGAWITRHDYGIVNHGTRGDLVVSDTDEWTNAQNSGDTDVAVEDDDGCPSRTRILFASSLFFCY